VSVVALFELLWGDEVEQAVQAVVVVPVDVVMVRAPASARVRSGPARNGEPAAAASFLNRPMNDSATALSVGVADGTDRGRQSLQRKRFGKPDGGVLTGLKRWMHGTAPGLVDF
jgi:hypothetical protein